MNKAVTLPREVVESIQKRLIAALDEPRETMSDGKALREIVRQLRLMRDEFRAALAAGESKGVDHAVQRIRALSGRIGGRVMTNDGELVIPFIALSPQIRCVCSSSNCYRTGCGSRFLAHLEQYVQQRIAEHEQAKVGSGGSGS